MSCRKAHRLISVDVDAELGGHHAGQVRGLHQVLEHVLAVRRAVAQPAEQGHQLRVHVGDADLDQRVLAGPDAQPLHLRLALLVLSSIRCGWMRPSRTSFSSVSRADLPAHRVEAGEQDRLGGVVDDQVDAGDRLEGADVAALAADDAALHLVARQVQHADDDRLGGLLAGQPLDGAG